MAFPSGQAHELSTACSTRRVLQWSSSNVERISASDPGAGGPMPDGPYRTSSFAGVPREAIIIVAEGLRIAPTAQHTLLMLRERDRAWHGPLPRMPPGLSSGRSSDAAIA